MAYQRDEFQQPGPQVRSHTGDTISEANYSVPFLPAGYGAQQVEMAKIPKEERME
jgi:hypothetical protein